MVPLPWERLLWSGRPVWATRVRYTLTDFRLAVTVGNDPGEAGSCSTTTSCSTTSPTSRSPGRASIACSGRPRSRSARATPGGVRSSSAESAAALRWRRFWRCSPDNQVSTALDVDAVRATLAWDPAPFSRTVKPARCRRPRPDRRSSPASSSGCREKGRPSCSPLTMRSTRRGSSATRRASSGSWRTRSCRGQGSTLAPIVGGADRVGCDTCHGADSSRSGVGDARRVGPCRSRLVRERGWEVFSRGMDPQLRNAIYGYAAELDNQTKAAYMRQVVLPGMARLLHRPAYDFTRSYTYNRSQSAFGCYHCHQVRE